MRIHVVAGFGEPITAPWLDRIRSLAHGVRVEIPNGSHHEDVERIVGEIATTDLDAIYLLNGWLWMHPETKELRRDPERKPTPEHVGDVARSVLAVLKDHGSMAGAHFEVGPEINIDPVYRKGDNRWHLLQCLEAVRLHVESESAPHRIIAGSVSNLARADGMAHLRSWVARLDPWYAVGVHPYRTTGRPGEFAGYRAPSDMLADLAGIINGRELHVTEAGWHDWTQTRGSWPCSTTTEFSPAQVADFVEKDIELWKRAHAETYCVYQLRDAPEDGEGWDHHDGHFGIWSAAGEPKPLAHRLKDIHSRNA